MQKLPSPRLVTDSMGAGGTPHVSYGGSAPGSMGVEPGPQPFEVPDIGAVLAPSGPEIPVSDESGRVRGDDGRFSQGGPWLAPGGYADGSADSGGWHQT